MTAISLLAAFASIGTLAYREHRAAEELRDTVTDLVQVHERLLSRASAHSTEQVDRVSDEEARGKPLSDVEELDRERLERRGADLLLANDYRAALEQYRTLSLRFPAVRAFDDFRAVLEWKLRCDSRLGKGMRSCP